jgi:hypothetical protein
MLVRAGAQQRTSPSANHFGKGRGAKIKKKWSAVGLPGERPGALFCTVLYNTHLIPF